MTMSITTDQLTSLLTAAAEAGAARVAAMLQPSDELISQRTAWEEFGRGTVEGWVANGMVKPRRVGASRNSKVLYSRSELKSLASAIRTSAAIVKRYKSHRTKQQ